MVKLHYHITSIDTNLVQIKRTFNQRIMLVPSSMNFEEYNDIIQASRYVNTFNILEQPLGKELKRKKKYSLKGVRNLDDILTLISNIVIFSKFIVKLDLDCQDTKLIIIRLLLDIDNIISSHEYRTFNNIFLENHKYITHTLVTCNFNILT